ncbi:amino acid ABC transporter permease [Phytohalomonas tamaricis]|uniref:amino acid ABC transporter permease n=1 Tax=Phytohalomonas tamaricis TaxID=2081032 RepID=UPI000D0B86E2|nr:amino acid ABC transporter permease [Phytohalomonas tamaricis]
MTEWDIIWAARDDFLYGFANTLVIFALSALLAFVLGCVIVYLLEGPKSGPRTLLRWLINIMRTLPFLILAYLLYYGLPTLGVRLDAWTAGVGALIVYHGAYFAELLRGARVVLPGGTVEAARAYGFTTFTMFMRIILPQLLIRTRPLIGNQLVICLKDTAFLTIITVQELTAAANSVQSTYFIPLEAFVVVIALYWLISICLEVTIKQLGRFGKKRGFEHA